MKSRAPLGWIRLLFLTVAAVVAADLTSVFLQWSWQRPPRAEVAPRVEQRSSLPTSVEQVVQETKKLMGDAPSVSSLNGTAGGPGGPRKGSKGAATPTAPAPDPNTTLTLLGTIVSPEVSVAFIQVPGNAREITVYPGTNVADFKVVEIRGNSVLLRMNGQLKTLFMPSLRPAPAPQTAGLLPPPPVPSPAASSTVKNDGKVVMSRSDVSAVMASPDRYMQDMRILPFSKDGHPYGMKVLQLTPGSLLNKMGIQPNDVLLSINGKNLFTPEDAFRAYQIIDKENHVGFRVERNGQQVPLEVEIR